MSEFKKLGTEIVSGSVTINFVFSLFFGFSNLYNMGDVDYLHIWIWINVLAIALPILSLMAKVFYVGAKETFFKKDEKTE